MSYVYYKRGTDWTLPSLPDLWSEARRMFTRAIAGAGEPKDIARAEPLTRKTRREVLAWFLPVSTIVRRLVIAKAVIHLLMTPQGRKLMRDARLKPAPPAPEPPSPAKAPHKITIPSPGWHTIYQHVRPMPPPTPCRAETPAEAPAEAPAEDCFDPATWRYHYPIARVHEAEAEDRSPAPLNHKRGPRISLLEPEPEFKPRSPKVLKRSPAPRHAALRHARRFEMIRRILDDPTRTVLRVARWLAAHDPDAVELPRTTRLPMSQWRHGDLYADQAREHALLALRSPHLSMAQTTPPTDDPG